MVVTGAWWDYVDWVATHQLRDLLVRFGEPMRATMIDWSRSDNLCKRRSSIICQNGVRERTDLELLYACIEPSLAERDFFLRKAIGWALREYSKADGDEVRRSMQTDARA